MISSPQNDLPPTPPAYGTPEADAAIAEVVDDNANLTDERR